VVGWIGSPTTAPYTLRLENPLLELGAKTPAVMRLVGANPLPFRSLQPEYIAWSEANEVEQIAGFDVGVMPLDDAPWERGKCGYKLIQYMACGLPVIASPVGVNRELVRHGENGYLAETEDEWRQALFALGSNPELRARMGRKGRSLVESSYCTRVTAPRLIALLEAAASPKTARIARLREIIKATSTP
jgi:glycosyltransferase involved in cell wall biosynthesis